MLSESGERELLPRLQHVAVELEVSERVADVLSRDDSSEHMIVRRSYVPVIDANALASRPRQPGYATPAFAHLPK